MMPPYSQVQIVHDQMIREALDHQGHEGHGQGLLQALGKALAHRFGGKYAETVADCPEIEATPDAALQSFRTLAPYKPALEERETACA